MATAPPLPLLDRLFDLLEESGPPRINIEDYLGVFQDVPGLSIPFHRVYHNCSFCQFVRRTQKAYADCLANKRAVNRLLQRGQRPFSGLCHLGVADLTHPVVVEGVCVAGLFYGSVVIRERAAEARARVRRYCRRRRLSAAKYLRELERLPKISSKDLPMFAKKLETVAGLLARMIEDSGVPLSAYRQEKDAQSARERAGYPRLLRAALRHLDRCYAQPVTRESAARHLGCNAAYLSTLFTGNLGMSFRRYLNGIRVRKAKLLLERSDRTAGEIAFAVGYEDQSHFNRRFREIAGMAPLAYRAAARR